MPGKIVSFFMSSIRHKVSVSFVIVIALILFMTITSYYRLNQVRGLSEQITPKSAQMGYLQDFVLSLSSLEANLDRFLVVRNAQLRESVLQDLQGMRNALASIQAEADEQERATSQEFEQVTLDLESGIRVLLDADPATMTSQEMNGKLVSIYAQADDARQSHHEFFLSTRTLLQNAAQKQMTTASDLTTLFVILSVVVIGIVTLVWWFISRRVASPLVDLAQTAIQIAEGDLQARAAVTTGDEVGRLAAAFNSMTAQLQDMIGNLKAESEARERLQQQVIEAQQQTLIELSTPIIPVMDRILVMPLIGNIDAARAKDIMRALLAGIREHRAQVVILDITGVPVVDSGVAGHLDKTIQAAQLKGARVFITGISDAVAEAIVDLGIDWNDLQTLSDLQTGLVVALRSLGLKLSKT
jgi:anti-anti-sigma regulatory factor/HAMP domain-containing protein